jgi:CarD family transcriptional regulator
MVSDKEVEERMYSIGDEIVHANYGVGEIVGLEEKELMGETKSYYVVKTKDSTYWIPVKKLDNERIRPIATPETIKDSVVEALEAEPQEMADNYKTRRKRINDVNGEIIPMAQVVRDLSYRQATDRLNTTERQRLDKLKSRLATEWAASIGITVQNARKKINKILRKHYKKEE